MVVGRLGGIRRSRTCYRTMERAALHRALAVASGRALWLLGQWQGRAFRLVRDGGSLSISDIAWNEALRLP